jgi:cobalt-zinc-cadmium efflux system membrane fusion protein
MTGRRTLAVFALGIAAGIAAATLVAKYPQALRNAAGVSDAEPARTTATGEESAQSKRDKGGEPGERQPASIKLAEDDIAAAGIELAPVEHGTLARWIIVPGTIVPGADRIARVSVRLSATVAELRKKLGDAVAKDEVLAVLESREVAEAKSEYLAARLTADLQKELYDRDKALFDRHVASEQQVLRSRSAVAQAGVKLDIARQKLFALGLTEKEIAAIPAEPQVNLRRQEVLAPMAGHVVDRKVDLGSAVGRDNLETELFTIADLERVWVELAVSPTDLPLVKEGQTVTVAAHGLTNRAVGKLVFISPMLDRDTHTARVVAEIANPDGNWRPGSLVRCAVAIAERVAPLTVPTSAVQTIGQVPVVFVRTAEGFEKRAVTLGETDDRSSEIRSGVHAGETVAVGNTFALKAEFTKALAED